MSVSKSATGTASNKGTKKQLLAELTSKLEAVLSDLKAELGEKKFGRRLKKAGKVLLHGLDRKQAPASKKSAAAQKAATPKKTAPSKKVVKKPSKAAPKKVTVKTRQGK